MNTDAWKFYLGFYKGKYKNISVITVLSILQSLTTLPIIYLVNFLIDESIPKGDLNNLLHTSLYIFILVIFSGVLGLYLSKISSKTCAAVIQEFREDLICRFYKFPLGYAKQLDTGKTHTILLSDIDRIGGMGKVLVSTVFSSTLACLFLSSALLYIEYRLFVLILFLSPIQLFITQSCSSKIRKKVDLYRNSFEALAKNLWFILSNSELTRQQNAEETEYRKQKSCLSEFRSIVVDMEVQKSRYGIYQNLTIGSFGIITLLSGGYLIAYGLLTLGELASFYIGAKFLQSYFNPLLGAVPTIISGNESINGVFNFINVDEPLPYSGKISTDFTGNINLVNVSFKYDSHIILDNASMSLNPGEITLLHGPNGSGKSTVTNLILGFYRPQKGFLEADNRHYEDLDISDLRSKIAIVPQHPNLFRGTIAENIEYGNSNKTMDQIIACASKTIAHQYIESLPNGYNTNLADLGDLISGGERQLIAICRALLREPKFLILDEPTNHLSTKAIRSLMDTLIAEKSQRTTLMISHDGKIAEFADTVYKIEDRIFKKDA